MEQETADYHEHYFGAREVSVTDEFRIHVEIPPQNLQMNAVNEDTLQEILTATDPNSRVRVLKWDINSDIVAAGTNYGSEVSRLTITYEKNDVEMKKILFLKVPFNLPTYNPQRPKNYDFYEKELTMYTKVLPQMYAFEEEYFTPRHYFFDEKMSLFLKDLSLSGYKNADRLEQLDVEHCYYALKCLAKFHGLSVKIEETYGLPDVVKNDHMHSQEVKKEKLKTCFSKGISSFIDHLPEHMKQKYPQQVAAFQSITVESIFQNISLTPGSFKVLAHGDFWTNNMMFKYDKYGILKKVKILDFQLCRWNTPAIDLIYFIITSIKFEVYEKYIHLLLDVYLRTLNKVLVTLGCRTCTMEELVQDLEDKCDIAYLIICCLLPRLMCNPNTAIDRKETLKGGETQANSRSSQDYKFETYAIHAQKWFNHFGQNGGFRLKK